MSAGVAGANERYAVRPPVMVSPDLAAPWVMQLQNGQARRTVPAQLRRAHQMRAQPTRPRTEQNYRARQRQEAVRTLPVAAAPEARQERRHALEPKYLPQQVSYDTSHPAGTIVIDSAAKFLYLVEGNGSARRYGVGVGKEGMGWTGTENVSRKAEWPDSLDGILRNFRGLEVGHMQIGSELAARLASLFPSSRAEPPRHG